MSRVTTFSNPAIFPAQMPPIRPATGPDMSRFTGRCVAESTVAIPPEDCMSRTPCAKPRAAQRLVEAGDVARDLRSDVRVQADGREALVLPVERQHLVRDREVGLRELLEHDLLDLALVLRVGVGVEKADGDRVHAGVAQRAHPFPDLLFVERNEHLAVGHGHALLDREPVAAPGERP